jgi:hypothetical protein
MAHHWENYEDFHRDYVRVLERLKRDRGAGGPTRDEIAKNLGISRFTLKRLHARFWAFRKSYSCDFCGESLPDWATKRKRFCGDACRAKHWRLARP